MNEAVLKCVEQLRRHFRDSVVITNEDGDGGAYVVVDALDLGPLFTKETRLSWIGFHVAYNYPFSDIYPHHVRSDLTRVDGLPLPTGMHGSNRFSGFDRPSVMISRRTTVQSSWAEQSAVAKLLKVIEWCGGPIERFAA